MFKDAAVAAGEIVIVLVGIFVVLLGLSAALLLTGHADSELSRNVLTWCGGAFFALLGVLGVKRVAAPGDVPDAADVPDVVPPPVPPVPPVAGPTA